MIRIDGSTPIPQRHLAIRRFNTERSLRVALVSVTAASLGVDLSAASTCIFAELPPDAAWLAQAEDRCHRKGQANAVSSTVLVAHCDSTAADDFDTLSEEVAGGGSRTSETVAASPNASASRSRAGGLRNTSLQRALTLVRSRHSSRASAPCAVDRWPDC